MQLIIKNGDLFNSSPPYAHCIAKDYRMGAGIAVPMNKKFSISSKLKMLDEIKVGKCYYTKPIFNLITKSKSSGKPTYHTLIASLNSMREIIIKEEIKYLNIPKIGCGLDRLSWGKVREIITDIFKDVDITITVYQK